MTQRSWPDLLLAWYDRHHRDLPWRSAPVAGQQMPADPYRVWLSEVMLQQTTVEAVKRYFLVFTERWTDVFAMAAASRDDVLRAWAGLGYYSRARNLKACADLVAAQGSFPDTEADLRALPGIGAYTAAAIAAIAFGRRATVIDGNIERVTTRLHAIDTPLPTAKLAIRAALDRLVPKERPGDFAQAMMDLGATICTPRRPTCILCPIRENCRAFATGDPERFPIKAAKAVRPIRFGIAYVAVRADGAVLLRKRPDRGLLGGMAEIPGTAWTADPTAAPSPPLPGDWKPAGAIIHVFTHFELRLAIETAVINRPAPPDTWWSLPEDLPGEALPTVMKKAIAAALPDAFKRKP